jgi:alkylation response protein AidB-like acyl-CoA dehydrogenase
MARCGMSVGLDRAESLRLIRDSAAAVAPPGGDLSRVRALRFTTAGFDAAVWRQISELGWIGLRVDEARGGAGLGMTECCALAEELGRGLVPEPLVEGMLAARVLAATDDEDLLAAVLSGEQMASLAWQEALDSLEAPGTPGAPRLFVPMARGATTLLLPVRNGAGLRLHVLPMVDAELQTMETQDGCHVSTLIGDPSHGVRLGSDVAEALNIALDEAALATAAYLLGVMERSFGITLGHLRNREQFGRPIGSFQSLQHRAVDLKIQLSLTRASVEGAAATLDTLPPEATAPRRAAVSRAKARAAEAALRVTREAVQMHGAIGYTDEHDVGLFLRKAMVLGNRYGSALLHRRRFIAHSALETAGAA